MSKWLTQFHLKMFALVLWICCAIGSSAADLNQLAVRLVSKDQKERGAAIQECKGLDFTAQTSLVPSLMQSVQDGDPVVRAYAWSALFYLGPAAHDVLPTLQELFKQEEDSSVKSSAKDAIRKINLTFSGYQLPQVIEKLHHERWLYRQNAAQLLGKAGLAAKNAIPALLVAAMDDDDDQVRKAAGEALGNMGTATEEIVKTLQEKLKDSSDANATTRLRAVSVLASWEPKMDITLPVLIEALSDLHESVRLVAVFGLKRKGPAANEAVAKLTPLLNDPNPKMAEAAKQAIFAIDPSASSETVRVKNEFSHLAPASKQTLVRQCIEILEASPVERPIQQGHGMEEEREYQYALLAFTQDQAQQNANRREVVKVLGKLGPEAHEAIPALITALKDQDRDDINGLGEKIADALGEIGPKALPPLLEIIKNWEEPKIPLALAVRAIGKMGPSARTALPELQALRKMGGRLPAMLPLEIDDVIRKVNGE